MSHPTILFVGGGSLGHLVPSIAVVQEIKRADASVRPVFVCADRSDETEMLVGAGLFYHVLKTSKCPRRLSLEAILFPVTFLVACVRSAKILSMEKPDGIFSKGGFISVPLCFMGWLRKIPIVHHESDSVLSLSSRLLSRMAVAICAGFPNTQWPAALQKKVLHTGNPVRSEIFLGSRAAGQRITGFSGKRPVLMILGGSQGSVALNTAVQQSLEKLLNLADIIHLTGTGKGTGMHHARLFSRPTVAGDLSHLYALADIVVSRAGAGVLSELAALRKAVIVIPLAGVAHDHQVSNTTGLAAADAVDLLLQENLHQLPARVEALARDNVRSRRLGEALHSFFPPDAAKKIAEITLAKLRCTRIES